MNNAEDLLQSLKIMEYKYKHCSILFTKIYHFMN